MKDDKWGAIRVTSFEVKRVAGDWSETTNRWHELSDVCKQMSNCVWQTWMDWHNKNESRRKLREFLNAKAAWDAKPKKQRTKKTKPMLDFFAVGPELSKQIYRTLVSEFPEVGTRVVTLLQQKLIGGIKNRKAAKGKLPGWCAILLYHEAMPSFANSVPIPFDVANSVIVPPPKKKDNYRLRLKMSRQDVGKTRKDAIEDTLELQCKGKKVSSQVAILSRIAAGEYKFCGSNLVYSKANKAWFVKLSYRMPIAESPSLDATKAAVLRACDDIPFRVECEGVRTLWPLGAGAYIGPMRRKIFLSRRSRAGGYKYASTTAKGHGRQRAENWRWKYQQMWKELVKRCNHNAATATVRYCIENGIGTIAYEQPSGSFSESRFLSKTGKDVDWNDATTWEWFQLKTFLSYRCERAGIVFQERKVGEDEPTKDVA